MGLTTAIASLAGTLGNSAGARTSTSTSTPTYSAAQTSVQNDLASTLESDLTNGVNTTPMMTAGTDAINKTYAGADASITQADAARGFGSSGEVGSAIQQSQLAKAGAVGGLQSNLDEYALQQDQNILQDAEGFGFASPGKQTSSTAAGSATAGGLAAGLTGLTANQNTLLQALGGSNNG